MLAGPPDELPGWIARLAAGLDALEVAFWCIAHRPLTDVRMSRCWQPLEAVRRPDATLRRAVQTGGGQGPEARLANLRTHRLQWAPRAVLTTDTPEHRWLAWQLDHTLRQVQRLADRLARPDAFARTRRQALMELATRLETLQQRLLATTLPPIPPPPTPRLLRAEATARPIGSSGGSAGACRCSADCFRSRSDRSTRSTSTGAT
ncbi:DUF2357 domain-containing protein [Rhodothermus marinus]|uniref:DUF2357 domain-containing protein n=1 Tax=Rhodothermus marinus TaxID=29549 RepID=UPI000A41F556|nr:DUF2357 domain-containing protein [Rhodothermus marinus]